MSVQSDEEVWYDMDEEDDVNLQHPSCVIIEEPPISEEHHTTTGDDDSGHSRSSSLAASSRVSSFQSSTSFNPPTPNGSLRPAPRPHLQVDSEDEDHMDRSKVDFANLPGLTVPASSVIKDLNTGKSVPIHNFHNSTEFNYDTFILQRKDAQAHLDVEHEEAHEIDHVTRENTGWTVNSIFSRGSSVKDQGAEHNRNVKIRMQNKRSSELEPLNLIEDIALDCGPIWTMAFSPDGNYLATAGADAIIRIWTVTGSPGDHQAAENRMKDEALFEEDLRRSGRSSIPTELGGRPIIAPLVFREFIGHSSDIVDLSWSKTNFLLSASLDRTVRLWHVSKDKCLSRFRHPDFVTSVEFHPVHVKLFVSGSYDNKIRIWNILDAEVKLYSNTSDVVTSSCFSPDGRFAVAGLADGNCIVFKFKNLEHYTTITCRNRRGKYSGGCKVTGLEFHGDGKHLLVTTCDSRIRLINLEDKSMRMKFKGLENTRLPIRASFSEDCRHVICGSEDNHVFMWNATKSQGSSNKNNAYEHFQAHEEATTVALFAPRQVVEFSAPPKDNIRSIKHIIFSAGFDGSIRVFEHRTS